MALGFCSDCTQVVKQAFHGQLEKHLVLLKDHVCRKYLQSINLVPDNYAYVARREKRKADGMLKRSEGKKKVK